MIELNFLPQKTIYLHKHTHKHNETSFDKVNLDDIKLLAVKDSQLINNKHKYYKIDTIELDVNKLSTDDISKLDNKRMMLLLMIGKLRCVNLSNSCSFKLDNLRYKSDYVSLTFCPKPPKYFNEGHHLQLILTYTQDNTSFIYWNNDVWIPLSEDMSPLLESLMKAPKIGNTQNG